MKAAVITPIPDLERFVGRTNIHMLLASRFNTPIDVRYIDFYARRRRDGEYLILDNGAYKSDGGKACSMGRLLEIAQALHVQEIVVPDSIYRTVDTMHLGAVALKWLHNEGLDMYEACGKPRVMIVPQGTTIDSWILCRDELMRRAERVMELVDGPQPVLGVSKILEESIGQGGVKLALARSHGFDNPVHLLGWAGTWHTLSSTVAGYPHVRSMDSARPVSYGKMGVRLDERHDFPIHRDADFFDDSVPVDSRDLVLENIRLFRELVGDSEYAIVE